MVTPTRAFLVGPGHCNTGPGPSSDKAGPNVPH
jgi:hypothetical protein